MSLDGRVAFVTGASRGIGRSIALALSDQGAPVACGFRNDLSGARETLESLIKGMTVPIDVTDPASVSAAFEEIEKELGAVEILVNNAGTTRDSLLLRMTEQDWTEVLETDLGGVFRTTKRALPSMIRNEWGRIVTIGSVVGALGNPGQTNYAAAKAGVVGFTKALALEVARKGITANVVAPGFVETALTAVISSSARSALFGRIAMGRPAAPEEIGEAVVFCARCAYLTGQVINVDGGLV